MLKNLDEKSLDLIFSWRNSGPVRHMMHNQREISYSEHLAWFENIKNSENFKAYIYLENSQEIGYMSFCFKDNKASWGFYLSPSAEKGTGFRMCLYSLNYLFKEFKTSILYGEVKSDNLKSIKLHERLGFEKCLFENPCQELKITNNDTEIYRYMRHKNEN